MELVGEKVGVALLLSLVVSYTALHISIKYYREAKHERFMGMKDEISKINSDLMIINNDVIETRTHYQMLIERRHSRLISNPNDSIEVERAIVEVEADLKEKLKKQIEIQLRVDSIRAEVE